MALQPQYPGSGGGLYPATAGSNLSAPAGYNAIGQVPGAVPVGQASNGGLINTNGSPVSGGAAGGGYRTVLFGDSMTDTYETVTFPNAGSYDSGTGVLTLTITGHQQAPGGEIVAWNRNAQSTVVGWRKNVLSVIDANTLTIQIEPGLSGLPTANWMVRLNSWRSAQAFVPWLQAVSGQRFDIVRNAARSGDTTQECINRLQSECLSMRPQIVIMQMPGINDTSPGNGNRSDNAIFANQKAIIDRILEAGSRLVVMSTTPPTSGDARGNLANMARLVVMNRRLQEYCATLPGLVYFDAHAVIVNPASATGTAKTTLLRTSDNIHYSAKGGRAVAEKLWSRISSEFPSEVSSLPTSAIDTFWASAFTLSSMTRTGGVVTATISGGSPGVQVGEKFKLAGGGESWNEYVEVLSASATSVTFQTAGGADGGISGTARLGRSRNLAPNCLLTVATGGGGFAGATGTYAGNMRAVIVAGAPACVGSVVARGDGYGNNQRLVITSAASGNQVTLQNDFTTYATDVPSLVKAGRRYVGELSLSLAGVAGSSLRELRFNLVFMVGGTTYQTYALNGYADGAYIDTDATDLHLRTAPLLMPAGSVGTCLWQLTASFGGAGSALTIDVGRIRLEEIIN